MKKTFVANNGRTFDFFFFRTGEAFLDVTIYEVKHPERKWFCRRSFTPFYSTWLFIDDYDTIEDSLLTALENGLRLEEITQQRNEKFKKFMKGD